MKLRNELTTVTLAASPHQRVEALVRVRGIDVRVAGRGVIVERRDPVAVLVRRDGGDQRIALSPSRSLVTIVALVAAPLAARIVTRIASRTGRSS